MKILFFTSSGTEYLSDSLLHGLKTLYGENIIDYPKKDIMYSSLNFDKSSIHGCGFTLYLGLISEDICDRSDVYNKVKKNFFQYIIISDIENQIHFLNFIYPLLSKIKTKLIIIDGNDRGTVFPYSRYYLTNFQMGIFGRPEAIYFKREIKEYEYFNLFSFLTRIKIKFKNNFIPIAYSIPEEKINNKKVNKTKNFVNQKIDLELPDSIYAKNIPLRFEEENDYYNDIQKSKFGITMKKGGWDCMRHYEIAANDSLICFKNLHTKFEYNAPFGLNNKNCISYKNYNDLMFKIEKISDDSYYDMLNESKIWVSKNTTIFRAKEFIKHIIQ